MQVGTQISPERQLFVGVTHVPFFSLRRERAGRGYFDVRYDIYGMILCMYRTVSTV
jgi:hypothetical protein